MEEFDFNASSISTTQIRGLADGGYLERAEPVIFLGETGTGKTHSMTALCVEACRQNRRVRFTTVAVSSTNASKPAITASSAALSPAGRNGT